MGAGARAALVAQSHGVAGGRDLMAAYTDATKIAAYLGVTLTGPQQTQAGITAQAASDWIDQFKGRTWQAASPVSGEIQTVIGDMVWLNNRPVVAVTSVETRQPSIGAAWTALAAGQYELVDAAAGQLQLTPTPAPRRRHRSRSRRPSSPRRCSARRCARTRPGSTR
jgi:hypothetical protein